MDNLHVVRFAYFPRRWETLAGQDGGILNRLRANRLNYLLVPFFLLGQTWALVRLLRSERWDLIHAHWLIPQGLVALLARMLCRSRVPLICTSHGGDLFALRSAPLQALKRAVMQACAAVTVVSEAMRAQVLSMGIAPEKVSVIPMGVDLQQRFTLDPNGPPRLMHELLFVGRLVEKKGVDLLLRALPPILETHPETRLVIAGGGPLEPDLRCLAEGLGLLDRVEFRGMLKQEELPTLYRHATLFVAPFRIARSGDQEGLGLVLVEASGCGCPVICGNVSAVQDVIEDDYTGVLVNPDETAELADAIVKLLSDPQRQERLARQARTRCLESFDWDSISARYCVLLQETLKASSAPLTRMSHASYNIEHRQRKADKIIGILEVHRPLLGLRILEVGTGSGVIASRLAQAVGPDGTVIATDIADQRIVHKGYSFIPVTDTCLPFPDASFDIVVSNHVLEHVGPLPEQLHHLREIHRVLRSNGIGYMAVPNRWAIVEPHYRLAFLSWLPRPLAHVLLAIRRKAQRYDCYPPGPLKLKRWLRLSGLNGRSVSSQAIRLMADLEGEQRVYRLLSKLPARVLDRLYWLMPTLIVIIDKKRA